MNLTSRVGKPVTGYATISNRGTLPDAQNVRTSGGNSFFQVAYYGIEGNITSDLLSGAYRTPELRSRDTPVSIRVSITPNKKKLKKTRSRKSMILRKSLSLTITATSTFDPTIQDMASILVRTY